MRIGSPREVVTAEPLVSPVPDVAGAVAGWRRWLVEDDWGAGRLVSPVTHAGWPPRAAKHAHCRFGRHDAPAAGCGCGLWAVADLSTLLGAFARGAAIGVAALWGRVVAGDRGWRGELGYPGPLFVEPTVRARTRDRLTRRYGVAVHALPASFESLVVVERARLEELAADVLGEVEAVTAGRAPRLDPVGPPSAAVAAFLAAARDAAPRADERDRARAASRAR